MKRQDAIERLRALERDIRGLGVVHLFLFGSVARDEAKEASDIDVFVDRDPAVPFGIMELGGLGIMLEGALGAPVEVGTRKGLHPLIRAEVERQAIQVF